MPGIESPLVLPQDLTYKAHQLQRSVARETIQGRGWRGLRQYGLFFACFWLYGVFE